MKIEFFLIVTVFLVLFVSCRTNVGPDNSGVQIGDQGTKIEGKISGRLKFEDGPFVVTDDIFVDTADTLIIDPGVYVYFEEGKRLIVEGLILARGEKDKKITFRAFNLSYWLGITVSNSSEVSEFIFCIIQQVDQFDSNVITSGALDLQNSNAVFQNCIFQYNLAHYGGGLAAANSTVDIINCIFRDNSALLFGGAILVDNSACKFINNTIFNNNCYQYGGGLLINEPLFTDIQNNIFYKNTSQSGDPRITIFDGDSSNVIEQYNFLDDGFTDPGFISNIDDFRLSSGSPCIDSGNPDSIFNDYDGTRNDQGAYGGPKGNW